MLEIPLLDFLDMQLVHVYWRLKKWRDDQIRHENSLRVTAFYTIMPHWSGKMPLKHLWQVWPIPEVDGEFSEMKIYANVREQTAEEKKWFKDFKEKHKR